MRQTQLFTKTRKEAPSDEVSKNADLLIRGGFIQKEMAGAYSYLPLGLRVLTRVQNIIREEINAVGGQEMFMTALQEKDAWEKTGRWSDDIIDVWFKTKLKNDTEIGLASTHEEAITRIMTHHIGSYKDLPFSAYQFQTKFRNEIRAKSGIMRTREFIMKDLYSFHTDHTNLDAYYDTVARAYKTIFERVGLGDMTYMTFASGGAFSKYSHEFQTVCDTGEDIIYVDENKKIAVNKEVFNDEVLADLGLEKDDLVQKKSIEVGNIFKLGTRFSDALDLSYIDEKGDSVPVVMGCYGIGPARVMGTIVELLSDEAGIIWPASVAPFAVHLVRLGDSVEVVTEADRLYAEFRKHGVEVLYDDRALRPGEKFADADLIGIPVRVVVSEKTMAQGKLEVKYRNEKEVDFMTLDEVLKKVL